MYSYDRRIDASKDSIKLRFVRYNPRIYSGINDVLEYGDAFDFEIKIGVDLKGEALAELLPNQEVTEQSVLTALKRDRKVLDALLPEIIDNVSTHLHIDARRLTFDYPPTMEGRVKITRTPKTGKTSVTISHLVLVVKVAAES